MKLTTYFTDETRISIAEEDGRIVVFSSGVYDKENKRLFQIVEDATRPGKLMILLPLDSPMRVAREARLIIAPTPVSGTSDLHMQLDITDHSPKAEKTNSF